MIILDTNVLSELVRQEPNRTMLAWLDSIPSSELATTAITAAELGYGAERLPEGRRKAALKAAIRQMLDDDFTDRVMPFDKAAARVYSTTVAECEALGRPISAADAQIAAICLQLGATVATQNVKDFKDTGVKIIDPWNPAGKLR